MNLRPSALALCLLLLLASPAGIYCSEGTYCEPGGRFSLTIPQGGAVTVDPLGITVVTLQGKEGSSFPPTVKIVAVPMKEGVSLPAYVQNSIAAYREIWKVEEDREVLMGGEKGRRLIIIQSLPTLTTKVVKYFFTRKGHIFVITCAAAPKDFDDRLPLFEEMVGTFKPFPGGGSTLPGGAGFKGV